MNLASLKLSANFSISVCWISETILRLRLLDLTESEGRFLPNFFNRQICIGRDNPLVPLLPDTPFSVCQMRKSVKLSVKVEF